MPRRDWVDSVERRAARRLLPDARLLRRKNELLSRGRTPRTVRRGGGPPGRGRGHRSAGLPAGRDPSNGRRRRHHRPEDGCGVGAYEITPNYQLSTPKQPGFELECWELGVSYCRGGWTRRSLFRL